MSELPFKSNSYELHTCFLNLIPRWSGLSESHLNPPRYHFSRLLQDLQAGRILYHFPFYFNTLVNWWRKDILNWDLISHWTNKTHKKYLNLWPTHQSTCSYRRQWKMWDEYHHFPGAPGRTDSEWESERACPLTTKSLLSLLVKADVHLRPCQRHVM